MGPSNQNNDPKWEKVEGCKMAPHILKENFHTDYKMLYVSHTALLWLLVLKFSKIL